MTGCVMCLTAGSILPLVNRSGQAAHPQLSADLRPVDFAAKANRPYLGLLAGFALIACTEGSFGVIAA